jgi:hypothetical protein
VIRPAVAVGRVAVARYDYVDGHLVRSLDDGIEVVDLEPEEKAVAVGLVVGVGDGAMVVLGSEAVELEDEVVVVAKALVVWTTVVAAEAEEVLIPSAADFDIDNGNQGLGPHVVRP